MRFSFCARDLIAVTIEDNVSGWRKRDTHWIVLQFHMLHINELTKQSRLARQWYYNQADPEIG